MNPFTRSLLSGLDDPALAAWIADWDAVEALIIEAFKRGVAESEAAAEYIQARESLLAGGEQWLKQLQPFWRGRLAGGEPLTADPFQALLARDSLDEFVGNWHALQILPAAREAINGYLIRRLEDADAQP